ncbi:MAG: amino acid adenylation domain-containing protein, partial [Pseudomonadota bacterium]|nr:amino acid adenylation domain-containing protein [Pseudomonadota bacterium]
MTNRPTEPGSRFSMDPAQGQESPALRRARLARLLLAQRRSTKPADSDTQPRSEETAPATPAQQALWFIDQLEGPDGRYNIPIVRRFDGPLDVAALERALQGLVDRHSSLRTSFEDSDGAALQRVHASVPIALVVETVPNGGDPAFLEARLLAQVQEAFDLRRPPLIRALLLRTAPTTHVLSLVVCHMVSDGWSIEVIERDLAALYRIETGAPDIPPLAPAPDFIEHARASAAELDDRRLVELLAHWRDRLAGLEPLTLPGDLDDHDSRLLPARVVAIDIPAGLVGRLRSIAHAQHTTGFTLLLAAFNLLLARLSGREDITIGTPVARRDRPELQSMIGCLLDTLVLRTDTSGNPRFDELLGRAHQTMMAARAHRDLPFETLVADLRPGRTVGRNPLFDIMINQFGESLDPADWGAISVAPVEPPPRPATFGATLYIRRTGAALRLRLACSADRYSRAWADIVLAQFCSLLEQIAQEPAAPIGSYRLDRIELDRVDWPVDRIALPPLPDLSRALPAPAQPLVLDRIIAHARQQPDAIAVREPKREFTYSSLIGRALALSGQLREQGVRAGDVVAVHGERGFAMIGAMLAAIAAGAAPMPLDPALPLARRLAMLGQARARLACCIGVTHEHEAIAPICPVLALDTQLDAFATADGVVDVDDVVDPGPDSPAYVFFTSGSTGTPKAILGRRRGLDHFIAWQSERFSIDARDRVSQLVNPGFDPMLRDIFLPLATGATACVPPADVAANVPGWLRDSAVSVVHTTPSVLASWIEGTETALPALRWLFVSGEPLEDSLVRRCRKALAGDYEIVNLYGPTETTMACCFHIVDREPVGGVQPIGRPIPDTDILVMRADGTMCGINEPGEIVIRTPFRSLDYFGRSAGSDERFIANPYRDDDVDQLYRSGDVGRLRPDGLLAIAGRNDDQVKIRGVRIEPAETAALLGRHPGVSRCFVLPRRDQRGDTYLAAFVVPQRTDEAGLDTDALCDFVRHRLPAAYVPGAIVVLDALPLLPNGKVDRKALPPTTPSVRSSVFHTPAPGTESLVAGLWAELLSVERVGRDDDFFALGGNSLLATRLIARIQRRIGLHVALRELFEAPSLAAFARRIDDTSAASPADDSAAGDDVARQDAATIVSATKRSATDSGADRPEAGSALDVAPDRDMMKRPAEGREEFAGHPARDAADRARSGGGSPAERRARLARLLLEQRRAGQQADADNHGAPGRSAEAPGTVATPAQQALWFLDQLEGPGGRYNVPLVCRLDGPLDVAALERALQRLLERHASLRTGFEDRDGTAWQRVHPSVPFALAIEAAPDGQDPAILQARLLAHGDEAFDLRHPPLIRALLLRIAPTTHVLSIVVHHIVSDAWSMNVIAGELAVLYRTEAGDLDVPPLAPAPSFVEHAMADAAAITTQRFDELIAYWRQRLAGLEPLVLSGDIDAPQARAQPARVATLDIPAGLADRLAAIANARHSTRFALLHAALDLLLARLTARDEVSVGTPVARRDRPDRQSMVGCLLDTLVLRTDMSGNPRFDQLLDRAHETMVEAFEHQDLPFETLVAELRPDRSTDRNPLFDIMINQFDSAPAPVDWGAIAAAPMEPPPRPARYGATLYIRKRETGLCLRLACRPDRFSQAWADIVLAQFRSLLEQIAQAPTAPIDSYRLDRIELDCAEPAAAGIMPPPLPDLSRALPAPAQAPVLERIIDQARRRPDAIAVLEGGREFSYACLVGRALALAGRLRQHGVEPGDVLAIHGERGFAMIGTMLAAIAAGAAPMPVDPALPLARRLAMLRQAQARLACCIGTTAEAEAIAAACPVIELDGALDSLHAADGVIDTGGVVDPGPDAPAYVFFTSGSTGTPKAILGRRRGLDHFIAWQRERFSIDTADRVSQLINPTFDAVLRDIFLPLSTGATACVPPIELAARVPDWLRDVGVSVVHTTPSVLSSWIDELETPIEVPALRWLFVSGEALESALIRRCRQALVGDYEIINLYGPTETTMVCCFHVVDREPANGAQPVGQPIADTEIHVLRPDGTACGINEPGELVIRTPFRSLGYLGSDREGCFISNPSRDDEADRLYRSGDIGKRRPDGLLVLAGRNDDQVKIRGVRVEPGETAAWLGSHPGVARCLVLPRRDERGDTYLAAFVVPLRSEETRLDARALDEFVRSRLPAAYAPGAIVFLDTLPLLPNGKVDRKALPPTTPSITAAVFRPPATGTESIVANLWAELLRVEQVGRDDDFFDLGGNSLLATRLIARLARRLGLQVRLRELFDAPTLAGFARRVEEASTAGNGIDPGAGGVEAEIGQNLPASHAQAALWLLDSVGEAGSSYNCWRIDRIDGPVDAGLLARTLGLLAMRHDAMRSRFIEIDGVAVRRIEDSASIAFETIEAADALDARQRIDTLCARPFDLGTAPLWRAALVRDGDAGQWLVLVMHHIVTDGWSMGILAGELGAIYSALHEGRAPGLAPLPASYADYVRRQQQVAVESMARSIDFWRQRLAGIEPITLPLDRPRPARPRFTGGQHDFGIGAERIGALSALARRHGATLYMSLLAAWQVVLSRHSGQVDIAVGTPVAGRWQPEFEPVVGYFVNMLVMRTDLSGNPSFASLLEHVRDGALESLAHQALPFDRLVGELAPRRESGVNPLFQVGFALQNVPARALTLAGATGRREAFGNRQAKFDMMLSVVEDETGASAVLEYAAELFDAPRIERIARHLIRVIDQVIADDQVQLAEIELLDAAEREQLRVWAQGPRNPYPADLSLAALFEAQARRSPQAIALECGDSRLSYAELNARANRVAHALRER